MSRALALPRNDPRQYDDLAGEWWRPDGAFAMLHWLAAARAALVPPAPRPGALLVDLGCGAGLLAPHAARLGYRHVGVDLVDRLGLEQAAEHGVRPVRGDVQRLPLADGVRRRGRRRRDPRARDGPARRRSPRRAGCCGPGGTLVLDTLTDTRLARLVTVTLGERIPGGAPRASTTRPCSSTRPSWSAECARHGVRLAGARHPAAACSGCSAGWPAGTGPRHGADPVDRRALPGARDQGGR